MSLRWDELPVVTSGRDLARSVVLAFAAGVVGLVVGHMAFSESSATIGGTPVPEGLSCEEDEVIAFDATAGEAPYPLACVYYPP